MVAFQQGQGVASVLSVLKGNDFLSSSDPIFSSTTVDYLSLRIFPVYDIEDYSLLYNSIPIYFTY